MKIEEGSDSGRTMQQGEAPAGGASSKAPARRGFLAGVGAAGVVGAAAIAAGRSAPPAVTEVAGQAAAPGKVAGRGYHETDHVRRYYDTAKV